ncbi:hypothetical protein BLA29_008179 [Euroglyphus maynei]|uniref:Uncharacterized protein n=1 Tax=Euroglyphus maynei TaxID=6958 RepID=A0A1Y3AMG9_EURMA|nr:hypothetical protein BLA29_008179 [Euroglyphus maynei]
MSKLKFLATPQPQTPTNLMPNMIDENKKSSSFDPATLQAIFEKSFRRSSPTIVNDQNIQLNNNNEITDFDILKRGSIQQSMDGFPFVPSIASNPHSMGVRPLFPHSGLHQPPVMPMNSMNPIVASGGGGGPVVPPMNNRMPFPPYPPTPFMMGNFPPRMMMHPIKPAEKQFMNPNHPHHGQQIPPLHPYSMAPNITQQLPIIPTHGPRIRNQPPMNLQAMFNESSRMENPNNDDNSNNSMAHKLLKNSKFTPTSVFRKLKDHENQANRMKTNSPKMSTTESESSINNNMDNSPKSK